jgi:hypothetical protein
VKTKGRRFGSKDTNTILTDLNKKDIIKAIIMIANIKLTNKFLIMYVVPLVNKTPEPVISELTFSEATDSTIALLKALFPYELSIEEIEDGKLLDETRSPSVNIFLTLNLII